MTTISSLKKLDLLNREDGKTFKITNITAKNVMYTFDLVTPLGKRREDGSAMSIYRESIKEFQTNLDNGCYKLN